MGRSPSSKNNNNELMKKGPWTPEEDEKLVDYIQKHGQGSWQLLPKRAGINRDGKSCRLRWTNYLRPDIKRGNFSPEEEHTIIQLHSILGNKWSTIATHLPGRTDNEIKNLWNTHLRKKLLQSGIDPQTHQSIITTIDHDINPLNLLLMNLPPLSMLPLPTPSFNNHIIRPPLENLAAKIRLLHDILLVLKTNIAPNNFLEESLHECFYKSEGFNPGIVNISSMVPNLEDISYNQDSNSFQPIGVTIPEFVNVQNKGIVSNNNNNTISDFSLPALLSSENQGDQNVDYYGILSNNNQVLVDCNDVDTCWGTILKGDEASTSSFWKDIFIE